MAGDDAVTREMVLPFPRDDVWRALTDPASVGEWLGPEAVLDATPRGEVACRRSDGALVRGTVLSVTPPLRLVLVWAPEARSPDGPPDPTRVEIVLTREGEGTLLTVRESAAIGLWVPGGPAGGGRAMARASG